MRVLVHFLVVATAFVLAIIPRCVSIDPDICATFPSDANPWRIEGRIAEPDSRPWIVLAWISCEGDSELLSDSLHTCEGALIRNDWVLTAASCFPCGSKASVIVDIGLHNSNIRTEILRDRGVERVGVDKVLLQPDYAYPSRENDIALLHLTKAVQNASRVISLVDCTGKHSSRVGRFGLSSGWGATLLKSTLEPKPLLDAHVCVWPPNACEQTIGEDMPGLLCAGSKETYQVAANVSHDEGLVSGYPLTFDLEADSCYVERGSPLVLGEPRILDLDDGGIDIVCEWRLCGVFSFGMQCGEEADLPGFFTEVCQYQRWIERSIQDNNNAVPDILSCTTLPQPPLNGYLCASGTDSTHTVQFCCDRGYRINGSLTATCSEDTGRWEPEAPACLPIECPTLPSPLHGTTNPPNCSDSSYQTGCWFSCGDGYQLPSSGLLVCGEDGEWSSQPPNCQAVNCGPPPHAGNLQVKYTSTDFNSTAQYSCRKCSHMDTGSSGGGGANGTVVRYCDASGNWNGPQPICKAIECPPLVPPTYGALTQSSHMCGSKVRFECDQGFTLVGATEVQCTEAGEWSHPIPLCTSIACPAPVIEDSNFKHTNNSQMYMYPYGTEIEVVCDYCKHLVDGEGKLTCTIYGEWDKSLPSCQWAACPLPRFLDHGEIHPLGQLYFCGTTVTFECEENYILEGANSSACLINGTWSKEFPTCRELICPELVIPNATLNQSGRMPGDVINISCDPCFTLSGANSLTCLETALWDRDTPSCEPITCPPLHELAHGRITPGPQAFHCPVTVLFSCDTGFIISGPPEISCTEAGEWTDVQPTCEAVHCPPIPPSTPNSHVCPKGIPLLPTYNTTVVYCCDEGFKMERGNSEAITCTEEGEWNTTAPICEAIICKVPASPENGYIQQEQGENQTHPSPSTSSPSTPSPTPTPTLTHSHQHYPYSTELRFACDEGYSLIGAHSTTCMEDGTWSNLTPRCDLSQCTFACSPPIPPQNGRVVNILQNGAILGPGRGRIQLGAVVVFMCHPGYYLHGSASRRCRENNVWSGQIPACLPFEQPRGRFIFRDPSDSRVWLSTDSAHMGVASSLFLACQTHMERTGVALPIQKIKGPLLDARNVRIRAYGNPSRSTQLALYPRTAEGGRSMAGIYLCQVQSTNNTAVVMNHTLTVHVHDSLCSLSPSPHHGSLSTSGTIPGSCVHYHCSRGYRLHGNNNRLCLGNGTWSAPEPMCVSLTNTHCAPPPLNTLATVTPPPTNGTHYEVGGAVTYHCPPTHDLIGQSQRVCLGASEWSGKSPICAPKAAKRR